MLAPSQTAENWTSFCYILQILIDLSDYAAENI